MDENIVNDVREYGWSLLNVSDHQSPFQYTVGLMESCRHPEFIIFGLDGENAHALVSGLIQEIRKGRSFERAGVQTVNLGEAEHHIGLRRVDPTQHELFLGFAMGYVRRMGRIGELEAMQIFWPDATGKFPYEPGCDLDVFRSQPRLDTALTPTELEHWRSRWE